MNFKNFQIPGLLRFSPSLESIRFITSIEDPKSAHLSYHYFASDYEVIANTIRDRHPNILGVRKITLDFLSGKVADSFEEYTGVIADACEAHGIEFSLLRKGASPWT